MFLSVCFLTIVSLLSLNRWNVLSIIWALNVGIAALTQSTEDCSSYASRTNTLSDRSMILHIRSACLLLAIVDSLLLPWIYCNIDWNSSNTKTSHYCFIALSRDSTWHIQVFVNSVAVLYIWSSVKSKRFFIAKVNTFLVDTIRTRLYYFIRDAMISDFPVPMLLRMNRQVFSGSLKTVFFSTIKG